MDVERDGRLMELDLNRVRLRSTGICCNLLNRCCNLVHCGLSMVMEHRRSFAGSACAGRSRRNGRDHLRAKEFGGTEKHSETIQ